LAWPGKTSFILIYSLGEEAGARVRARAREGVVMAGALGRK